MDDKIILKVKQIDAQPVTYEDFPHEFFMSTEDLLEFGDESLAEDGWQVPSGHTGDNMIWLKSRTPGYFMAVREILLTYLGVSFSVECPDGTQEVVRVIIDDNVYNAILRNLEYCEDSLEYARRYVPQCLTDEQILNAEFELEFLE